MAGHLDPVTPRGEKNHIYTSMCVTVLHIKKPLLLSVLHYLHSASPLTTTMKTTFTNIAAAILAIAGTSVSAAPITETESLHLFIQTP